MKGLRHSPIVIRANLAFAVDCGIIEHEFDSSPSINRVHSEIKLKHKYPPDQQRIPCRGLPPMGGSSPGHHSCPPVVSGKQPAINFSLE